MGEGEVVEFRLAARQRAVILVLGAGAAAYGFLTVGLEAVLVAAVVFGGLFAFMGRFGVTLTPAELVVHGVTDRRLPWGEVQGVGYALTQFSTSGAVWDAKGDRWVLRAPTSTTFVKDPELRRKLTVIEDWWTARRGPQWRPVREIRDEIPAWKRER